MTVTENDKHQYKQDQACGSRHYRCSTYAHGWYSMDLQETSPRCLCLELSLVRLSFTFHTLKRLKVRMSSGNPFVYVLCKVALKHRSQKTALINQDTCYFDVDPSEYIRRNVHADCRHVATLLCATDTSQLQLEKAATIRVIYNNIL